MNVSYMGDREEEAGDAEDKSSARAPAQGGEGREAFLTDKRVVRCAVSGGSVWMAWR